MKPDEKGNKVGEAVTRLIGVLFGQEIPQLCPIVVRSRPTRADRGKLTRQNWWRTTGR